MSALAIRWGTYFRQVAIDGEVTMRPRGWWLAQPGEKPASEGLRQAAQARAAR